MLTSSYKPYTIPHCVFDSAEVAAIDDTRFYRVDKIEKAASNTPPDAFSILLSHTPEVYRHAAHAGFDLLLSGHTHGGQICLPASIPITLSGYQDVSGRALGSITIWSDIRPGAGSVIVACPQELPILIGLPITA